MRRLLFLSVVAVFALTAADKTDPAKEATTKKPEKKIAKKKDPDEIGNRDVGHGQLQRRYQRVTLPDRNVRGLRLRPSLLRMMDLHPFRPRHVTDLFAGQLQTRFFTYPQHFSDGID